MLQGIKLSVAASLVLLGTGAVHALEGEITFTGIPTSEVVAALDPAGTTATVTFSVAQIPLAASEHSPPCATHRMSIEKIPISGNGDSECVRVCITPPTQYEFNSAIPVEGSSNHAYAQIFNPQVFSDTGRVCVFGKNWSAHEPAYFSVRLALCKAGSGCMNPLPVVTQPPAPAPVAREPASMRNRVGRKDFI